MPVVLQKQLLMWGLLDLCAGGGMAAGSGWQLHTMQIEIEQNTVCEKGAKRIGCTFF